MNYWPISNLTVLSKLCVLVYRCLHGSAPCYTFNRQSVRRRTWNHGVVTFVRSVSSADLIVAATRRSTLGDRAGTRAWNILPDAIYHATSNAHSRRIISCGVFHLVCWLTVTLYNVLKVTLCYLLHSLQIDNFTLHSEINGNFGRKSHFPGAFIAPLLRGSLGIGHRCLGQRTRMMGYRVEKEV